MKPLRDIFKSLSKFADKWDPYFDVYETWFSSFRGQSPRILEIGVQHGGSAEMWLEYFGEGTKIVGVDVDPRCLQHNSQDIEIVIGDQADRNFWNTFFQNYNEPFDIAIDDGGHRMQQMIMSFVTVSQHIRDGGIYLVEDLHTAYWNHIDIWPIGPWDDMGLYNVKNMMEFTKAGLDVLNKEHIEPHIGKIPQLDPLIIDTFKHVKAVHYYNSMIVFEIGKQKPFVRCLNNSGTQMKPE
jgi:SAM-dependent methyltransferase